MGNKVRKINDGDIIYVGNKPKVWVRRKFNEDVANLRRTRRKAHQIHHDFTNDEIYSALIKQDMSRSNMSKQIFHHGEVKISFSKIKWVLQKPDEKATI